MIMHAANDAHNIMLMNTYSHEVPEFYNNNSGLTVVFACIAPGF